MIKKGKKLYRESFHALNYYTSESEIKKSKKSRSTGPGPDRKKLKLFQNIGYVPSTVINEAKYFLKKYKNKLNEAEGMDYSNNKDIPLINNRDLEYYKVGKGKRYGQIILQKNDHNDEDFTSISYNEWVPTDYIQNYLENTYKKVHRTRINILPPNHELDWHIDNNTSKICRVQICIQGVENEWQFKHENKIKYFSMKNNHAYFCNIGITHRVVNKSDNDRIVILFGVEFKNIPNNEKLYV